MRKVALVGYALGLIGVVALAVAVLAPDVAEATRHRISLIKTAIVDGENPSLSASVDVAGNLSVRDSRFDFVPHGVYGAGGGLRVAQQGPIEVSNFPAVQQVDITDEPIGVKGTVNIGNLPSVQQVQGDVAVSNFPAVQTVDGSVAVNNLPAVQDVNITNPVSVANFPSTQEVAGTVTVGNFPSLDVKSLVYLAAFGVNTDLDNPESLPLICTQGFKYTVPAGNTLLITDITFRKNGPGFAGLAADNVLVIRWADSDNRTVSFSPTSPLVISPGKTLCPVTWGSAEIDLFLSGQLVNAP